MFLRDFMATHRDEILRVCCNRLHEHVAADRELEHDVEIFFDEIQYALSQRSGSLSTWSSARAALDPAKLPIIFGAISSAVGCTGERYELDISADEYDVFNYCIDSAVSGVSLDLHPIRVAKVLRTLQASATPERDISVVLEVDESLHIAADEMLLSMAIGNLLHNALEFSRDGGRVIIRCRGEDLGVVVEVEDECGGLSADAPDQLFRPFVSGRHQAGNGLGLAIAQRAVLAMGGDTYVENQPGRGCTFGVLFPPARPSKISSFPPVFDADGSARR